jgi:2-polyprenyl-3-methyl-5-hydroxy-6-metoxy-1,4-benzoquinol methylase
VRERRLKRTLAGWKERILWGGKIREEFFIRLLRRHYKSLFRRLWELDIQRPHFTNHRLAWFLFGFGDGAMHPYQLARAFFSAETLSPDDVVLDIGCGDGFLTKHFLSAQCSAVDAIDIEPAAIREAKRTNARPNITYTLRDAAKGPFPREKYDVIFWNGAIGHFAASETALILKKIAAALNPDGVFAGSESLGHEGHDHLQFFKTHEDLGNLFRSHFAHVSTKTLRYPINNGTFVRDEAYWRCSNSSARLAKAGWRHLDTHS